MPGADAKLGSENKTPTPVVETRAPVEAAIPAAPTGCRSQRLDASQRSTMVKWAASDVLCAFGDRRSRRCARLGGK